MYGGALYSVWTDHPDQETGYVQLSLIGAKAEVSHQDSIDGKVFETFITPMCFIQ